MSRPASVETYDVALRMFLCMGCLAYLATGVMTLVLGHCFGLLSLPLPAAMATFLMWWMLVPVLPSLILHPLAVSRVRARISHGPLRRVE